MILHDSHAPAYRDPIGPVKAGGRLTVRIACDESDRVTLRTWDGTEQTTPMRPAGEHLFEATIAVPQTPMLFWYDFIIHAADGDIRYGNAWDELGGEGALAVEELQKAGGKRLPVQQFLAGNPVQPGQRFTVA